MFERYLGLGVMPVLRAVLGLFRLLEQRFDITAKLGVDTPDGFNFSSQYRAMVLFGNVVEQGLDIVLVCVDIGIPCPVAVIAPSS